MKILLVDASEMIRTIQKKILAELGVVGDGAGEKGPVEFFEAVDGAQALQLLAVQTQRFDLILIEWNLPNMDTLLMKLRETDKTTPVIMCTADGEKSRVLEAVKAGASNYVVKPFTPETLLEKVRATLAKCAA